VSEEFWKQTTDRLCRVWWMIVMVQTMVGMMLVMFLYFASRQDIQQILHELRAIKTTTDGMRINQTTTVERSKTHSDLVEDELRRRAQKNMVHTKED